jgi:hypothetical protein
MTEQTFILRYINTTNGALGVAEVIGETMEEAENSFEWDCPECDIIKNGVRIANYTRSADTRH